MKFSELFIGQVAECFHRISEDDIKKFVELSGDNNRLHVDSSYALNTEFKRPVAHGILGVSFISNIIGTKLPGDGALWFASNIEFLHPVYVGDELTIIARVIKKDESNQIVELQTSIYNQERKLVTDGTAKIKIVNQLEEESNKNDTNADDGITLVLGGTGLIGSEVSTALAIEGHTIALQYLSNKTQASKVIDLISHHPQSIEKKVLTWKCDIRDKDQVASMIDNITKRLGPIKIIVNCTSPKITKHPFNNLLWSDFQYHFDNQILGIFNVIQCVTPSMIKNNRGKIILINSLAFDAPVSNLVPYITGKGALTGFMRSLAYELGPHGIQVNAVSPGYTTSNNIPNHFSKREELLMLSKIPLRRVCNPKDVASAVCYLASNHSNYLSGETIRVNGGVSMI